MPLRLFLLSGLAVVSVVTTVVQPAAAQAVPNGYRLVWSDDFNTAGLPNPAKWRDQTFGNGHLWWHNERQYYTTRRPENAVVTGGRLVLTVRRESLAGAPGWAGQEFTSAKLVTAETKAWTYGFFEVRAKFPCGRGVWPAVWLMSATGSWPNDGEIDFMEAVGFEHPPVVHATLHNSRDGTDPLSSRSVVVSDGCDAFHNYQLDWRQDSITALVDGRSYFHQERGNAGYDRWPYNHPFYLAMNVAVGGAWGAQKGIDASILPQTMEIEYVRVYQPAH
jgi:beta-glucanase (GH16 family)